MNTRLLAAAMRAFAEALEAPSDVPTVAPGADDLVDAKSSGIGVKLFRRIIREGRVSGFRTGRRLVVRRSELNRWLADNAVKPQSSARRVLPVARPADDADIALAKALKSGALHLVNGGRK